MGKIKIVPEKIMFMTFALQVVISNDKVGRKFPVRNFTECTLFPVT